VELGDGDGIAVKGTSLKGEFIVAARMSVRKIGASIELTLTGNWVTVTGLVLLVL
jgi:hypothetical protein